MVYDTQKNWGAGLFHRPGYKKLLHDLSVTGPRLAVTSN
jgi:hypothetical protein